MSHSGGRNNWGRITSFHRGGGHHRRYRLVDFRRLLIDIPARVIRFERDPVRRAPLALLLYSNGVLSYILAARNMRSNIDVMSGNLAPVLPANNLSFKNIPIGTFVHNVEHRVGLGGTMIRTAGGKAQILRKSGQFSVLRLPSHEIRYISNNCHASIGTILGSAYFRQRKLIKAGNKRWLGRRPIVRGVAMNPVDHPMGGGEGKTSGGRPSVSPWGILTKGFPTRSPRKLLTAVVRTRRKANQFKRRKN